MQPWSIHLVYPILYHISETYFRNHDSITISITLSIMLCGLRFPSHFFPWCFAGHTFHSAFHNVFRNAFRYVKLCYVRDGSVLRCIMLVRNAMWDLWVTLCGWRCVGDSVWVMLCRWRHASDGVVDGVCVTLCGWWCDGDNVWITLRGKHYVADAVQMTLRGWRCVSIHTGVKTQFRSK